MKMIYKVRLYFINNVFIQFWYKRRPIVFNTFLWQNNLRDTINGRVLLRVLELNEDEQKSYEDAKAKIIERMSPVQFVSINRRFLSPETLTRRTSLGVCS